MDFQEQIRAAMAAHGMWKAQLRFVIDNGTSDYKPEFVEQDDQCEFGKWLYAVQDSAIRRSAEYERCVAAHAFFHCVASRVLTHALNGNKRRAEAELAVNSEYARASSMLISALRALSAAHSRQDAGLQ